MRKQSIPNLRNVPYLCSNQRRLGSVCLELKRCPFSALILAPNDVDLFRISAKKCSTFSSCRHSLRAHLLVGILARKSPLLRSNVRPLYKKSLIFSPGNRLCLKPKIMTEVNTGLKHSKAYKKCSGKTLRDQIPTTRVDHFPDKYVLQSGIYGFGVFGMCRVPEIH